MNLDDKRNFIDGKGDIPDIIERYKNRRTESPTDRRGKCFFVPYNEIKENGYDLSISKYREIEYEEVEYEKPEVKEAAGAKLTCCRSNKFYLIIR